MYVGMHDFWIDALTGHVALSIKHAAKTTVCARGQSQVMLLHPVVAVTVSDLKLKARFDNLFLKGERGTKVPDIKVRWCS